MIVVGVVVKWYAPDHRSFNHPHHQFPHPAIPAVWLAKAFYPAGTTDIVMRKYLSFRGVSVPQQRHFSGGRAECQLWDFQSPFSQTDRNSLHTSAFVPNPDALAFPFSNQKAQSTATDGCKTQGLPENGLLQR